MIRPISPKLQGRMRNTKTSLLSRYVMLDLIFTKIPRNSCSVQSSKFKINNNFSQQTSLLSHWDSAVRQPDNIQGLLFRGLWKIRFSMCRKFLSPMSRWAVGLLKNLKVCHYFFFRLGRQIVMIQRSIMIRFN